MDGKDEEVHEDDKGKVNHRREYLKDVAERRINVKKNRRKLTESAKDGKKTWSGRERRGREDGKEGENKGS